MMGYGGGYDGYGNMMGGWFGGAAMLLFSALFLVGVVLLIVWAARASAGGHGAYYGGATPPPGQAGHDEAVAIAKRRFASGEITKEQYDEILRTLGG